MKREKYYTILLVVCVLSYFMMLNLSMTAVAEDLSKYEAKIDVIKRDAFIYDLRNSFLLEKEKVQYIHDITRLEYSDCEFIVQECKKKNLDMFILLGILKRESDFNPNANGAAGERGLGQLMENTAKLVAENLGYVYDPDRLYDARYNLKLTITQIDYLLNIYDNDVHKALTAYNRGQQGLIEYMEKSDDKSSAISDYSLKVMEFAHEYKENFQKNVRLAKINV